MGLLVTKDVENGELDELVEMIDLLIEQGSGHLTIDVDETAEGVKINRYSATECGSKPAACCQPNEKHIDEETEE
ncbi:MAG: hypothetical protein IKP47_11185 [Ruminococcus sp.]|nr:hypothetical protein [Ruminococcus sp.]